MDIEINTTAPDKVDPKEIAVVVEGLGHHVESVMVNGGTRYWERPDSIEDMPDLVAVGLVSPIGQEYTLPRLGPRWRSECPTCGTVLRLHMHREDAERHAVAHAKDEHGTES